MTRVLWRARPGKQTGLLLFAGRLLCGNRLRSLLLSAIGFGLLLCCVLVYCFGGLVAHGVLTFVDGFFTCGIGSFSEGNITMPPCGGFGKHSG
jgi:hypothetical protein